MKNDRRSFSSRMGFPRASEVILSYLESIDTPVSLGVWLRFKYDRRELLDVSISPSSYITLEAFHRDYLAARLLKKCGDLGVDVDRSAAAWNSFCKYEDLCRASNSRLVSNPPIGSAVNEVLYLMRKEIDTLLGKLDVTMIERIIDSRSFGGGVTSSCKGSWVSAYDKFCARNDITPRLKRVLQQSAHATDATGPLITHELAGNTISYVPKNSATDRTIAVEPHINAFWQRGVGIVIRSLLRKWGINLHDQSRNQDLALLGSLFNEYATIDLSGASDCLSIELVRLLLPHDWVSLLETLRSPVYQLQGMEGGWLPYEKHSSMGNGYTFELETLIFAACVKACRKVTRCRRAYAVYGDDIIVSTKAAPLVLESLQWLGFSPNGEKTFLSGPFRESCGADYWEGSSVTPFYLKSLTDKVGWIEFANWLRVSAPDWLPVTSTWKAIYLSISRDWAVKGPLVGGEVRGLYFVVNDYEVPWGRFRYTGIFFRAKKRVPEDSGGAYMAHLYLRRHYRGFGTGLPARPHLLTVKQAYSEYLEDDLSTAWNGRSSSARELGRWVRCPIRSFIPDWDEVRHLTDYPTL